jgi:hypothetical protein
VGFCSNNIKIYISNISNYSLLIFIDNFDICVCFFVYRKSLSVFLSSSRDIIRKIALINNTMAYVFMSIFENTVLSPTEKHLILFGFITPFNPFYSNLDSKSILMFFTKICLKSETILSNSLFILIAHFISNAMVN